MSQTIEDSVLEKVQSLYGLTLCNGNVNVHFLKMIKIPDGGAETIEKAIVGYANIPISKISSFGSDGAPVMVGLVLKS